MPPLTHGGGDGDGDVGGDDGGAGGVVHWVWHTEVRWVSWAD